MNTYVSVNQSRAGIDDLKGGVVVLKRYHGTRDPP